jgi:peptidoglycan/xylan/chitin deacetylase (PgdA/CDA1 family)
MLNDVSNVNIKILAIIVLVALLTATFFVYGFPQLSKGNDIAPLSSETYYYEPHIPQEGQRVVCIVFDDGLLSQYTTARPILDEYGLKATFAIITSYPDNLEEYMDWNKVITLHNQGHDIESHVENYRTPTSQGTTSIEAQLSQSKQDLLKHNINAPLFVYPQGEDAGDLDIEKLIQQHYYAACSTNHSSLNMSQAFNSYALPSYTMENATSMEMFKRYVNQANGSTIVIVYYRDISYTSSATSVTPENFAAHIQYLHDNNFTIQTLKQLFTSPLHPKGSSGIKVDSPLPAETYYCLWQGFKKREVYLYTNHSKLTGVGC